MPKPAKPSRFDPCPCYSGKLYHKCCQPLHEGAPAATARDLMRSRYAAYSLGLGEYIIDTTDSTGTLYQSDRAKWLKEILVFCEQVNFLGLKILQFEDGDESATVTFRADLNSHGNDVSFTENSQFYKKDGRWFYHSGANLQ